MNLKNLCLSILFGMLVVGSVQGFDENTDYHWPEDPLVRENLEHWQDLKFGFMMHWGTYSQWGAVASWALCSEDYEWNTPFRNGMNYVDYVQAYENLITEFKPVQFDPEKWAKAAKAAGMKYLVFTTKHHDGFAMFDTQYSDYKITGPQSPFRDHPKADVTREVLKAFRAEGLKVGVYFSKPDWHHDDYWVPEFATPDRNNNYDIRKYPERWERFKDFTYNQIEELMSQYGPIDILWLDGGWVRPKETVNDELRSWGMGIPDWDQNIDMPRIASMARKYQPGIIIVDRTVGQFENYRTPEQKVPDKPLLYPWETVMTMAYGWSFRENPEYKSAHSLVGTLIDVVGKGGNFLLNVGPSPDGLIDDTAYERMQAFGNWLNHNGEAIYETVPVTPYKEGKIRYTQSKDGSQIYAIYYGDEDELRIPSKLFLYSVSPAEGSRVTLLETGDELPWESVNNGALIEIPDSVRDKVTGQYAWAVRLKQATSQ